VVAIMLAAPFDARTLMVTQVARSSKSVHPRYANDLLTPRNSQVTPGKVPQQLDVAGLLVRKDDKPWQIHYSRKARRPYGAAGLNPLG
jgi:hypothetical protein